MKITTIFINIIQSIKFALFGKLSDQEQKEMDFQYDSNSLEIREWLKRADFWNSCIYSGKTFHKIIIIIGLILADANKTYLSNILFAYCIVLIVFAAGLLLNRSTSVFAAADDLWNKYHNKSTLDIQEKIKKKIEKRVKYSTLLLCIAALFSIEIGLLAYPTNFEIVINDFGKIISIIPSIL